MKNSGKSGKLQDKKLFSKVNKRQLSFPIAILIILAMLTGCEDNYISPIPNYPVSLRLNLTATYPTFKNSVGQTLTFEKPILATDRIGFGGIVVCTNHFGEYTAYDMSCPHEAKQKIKVKPNDVGQLVCDSCNSVYDISQQSAFPVSGPSKHPLKQYKTMVDGDYLHVFN